MQAPYTGRWEKKKWHLLHNFLVNPGFRLSPVAEEERSSPSSDSSSLPDLLLEPAPDRHDHPPDFYVGLERRMKRYYRQLFLGARSDDDDSSDFEVNRSMASSFVVDTHTRKDTEAQTVAESAGFGRNHSVSKKRQSTKSINEIHHDDASENQDQYDDKLIDATHNDTGHLFVDSKSSNIEDEENPVLIESGTINESNHSNETDDRNVNIEANGNNHSYEHKDDNQGSTNGDQLNRSGALNETEESSKCIETKSDSEEASCHRVSTTVAELHERRARDSTRVFDNGSPVLIPGLLQFNKSVFGSRRTSGQSFNVSEASDEFIRRLSSHKSDVSNKQEEYIQEPETEVERLLTASELTRASIDSDKPVDIEKVVESTEDKTQENDVHKNYDIQDRIQLSEIQTDNEEDPSKLDTDEDDETEITGIQNTSINWNKDGIDDDEDCFDNAIRRGEFTSKARTMVFISSSEESFDDLEPLAHRSAKSIDEVEVMRDARGSGVNESWHGEVVQDRPALAFEGQTDEFIRRLSSHKSDVSNKQEEYIQEPETEVERLLTASELTRASIDSDKPVDIEKVVESTEDKTQEHYVHKNYDIQDRIQLSEIQTDNEEDPSKLDTDEDDETEITGIQNTSINWNKDGIDDDEDCFDNAIRRGEFTSKARTMVFISSSEESFDDLEPLAQSSAKSIDEVEVMRDARGSGVNESWHGEVVQDSPALAFEGQTVSDADKLENESSVSTEINASYEQEIGQATEDPHIDAIAKMTDEFWSVSPIEVDIDEPKESRGSKRRTDSEGDATAKRRKRNMATQTGLEDVKQWEDIRTELFVGSPLVFRLCGCLDHICS